MPLKKEIKSFAKLNLFLRVLGKRTDGYHDIHTFFQKIDLHDLITIELSESSKTHISVATSDKDLPVDHNNLVFKAAKIFSDKTSLQSNIFIHLFKNIPVGAGLGGGSSNAAATLLALNEITGYPLSQEILLDLGKKIGSDVAFFIKNTSACIGIGRGEILEETTSFSGYFLLVYPGFGISTKWVYENLNLTNSIKRDIFISFNGEEWVNDLEKPVIEKYPLISLVKKKLSDSGAVRSLMTGSGSTVFGVYETEEKALTAFNLLGKNFPNDNNNNFRIIITKSI
jgi:4-diphosphocytidyl-2-C-methyl-D-erythritol kinase